MLSIDTHQCPVDTAPSQNAMLVPEFQEPPEAELVQIDQRPPINVNKKSVSSC